MINIISDLLAWDDLQAHQYQYAFPFGHMIVFFAGIFLLFVVLYIIEQLENRYKKRPMEQMAKRIHGNKPGPISDWDYYLARRELEKISEDRWAL